MTHSEVPAVDGLTGRNEDGRIWIRQAINKKDAENIGFQRPIW